MDRPIKIALVSPYDHGFRGGVTDHINNLANQFRAWGNTVRIIAPCCAPQGISDADFIPMGRSVALPAGGSIARVSVSVWLRPRIKALLRREAFDVIHLHEPFAGFTTFGMLAVAKSVSAVKVGTFHSYNGTRLYKTGVGRIARRYSTRLDGRIAVSEAAQQFASRHLPGQYEIIPNGIHVDDFANAVPFPHLRDGMINLLFVGRLEKKKGLKYLLGAYSRLKWDWPKLRLIVVGPGRPDDDSYRIMSERNLQDVVFAGNVSDVEKARYFKSADIYCSPATGRESFGIVLAEAMAAGTPVVASDIPGYSGVITSGREGLLVKPKTDEDLAVAIATLLRAPALRALMGANGRQRVEQFRWERVAARVQEYYKTVLDDRLAVRSA
jgi:phosphatidylinositol alpha-mannosyltransferase